MIPGLDLFLILLAALLVAFGIKGLVAAPEPQRALILIVAGVVALLFAILV